MAQYIRKYTAPPASERWNTVIEKEIAERLAEMQDWLSRTTDSISIDSLNDGIEDAESALEAAQRGERVYFAEDDDGGYYAVGDRWEDFDPSDIYDYEQIWFEKNSELDLPATDESTDEAIAASLERHGLTRNSVSGIAFDSLANKSEWEEAVGEGCKAWADKLIAEIRGSRGVLCLAPVAPATSDVAERLQK